MRLIDADALEKFLKRLRRELPKESRDFFTRDEMILNFQQYVHMQPTIDAVPVVRCEECKHAANDTEYCQKHNKIYCTHFAIDRIVGKRDFCSCGERKDDSK